MSLRIVNVTEGEGLFTEVVSLQDATGRIWELLRKDRGRRGDGQYVLSDTRRFEASSNQALETIGAIRDRLEESMMAARGVQETMRRMEALADASELLERIAARAEPAALADLGLEAGDIDRLNTFLDSGELAPRAETQAVEELRQVCRNILSTINAERQAGGTAWNTAVSDIERLIKANDRSGWIHRLGNEAAT